MPVSALNGWQSRGESPTLLHRISLTLHLLAIGHAGGDAAHAITCPDEVTAAAGQALSLPDQ